MLDDTVPESESDSKMDAAFFSFEMVSRKVVVKCHYSPGISQW